ncbi:MAG: response regulator transcription factor [Acidobacteriota bacterium]|nr:response regulator transcription factor [Acidobacteriota bacterium]
MHRCLLVDDDDDSREAYAEYLRGFGYEVQALGDSRNAMAAVARHRPDVVLVDLQMPHVDGFELIFLIKARPGPAVPVIVISACVYATDRALAEAARCDAFLTKPVLPADVLATIRMLMPPSTKDGSP